MMDSYNLSWKLAYTLFGLTPQGPELLNSYEFERKEIARELIDFDTKFSAMFSGKMSSGKEGQEAEMSLTHEQFLEVFSTGSGFTSGCGIQYQESKLVQHFKRGSSELSTTQDLLNGKLCAGRRLINAKVIRHADGNPRDLQDGKQELPCDTILANSSYTNNDLRLSIHRSLSHTSALFDRSPQPLRL